jgi:hypothetical protein
MLKKFYRFVGKPAGVAVIALALVTFSCQENAESPVLESQDQIMRYQNGDIIPGSYIVVLKPQSLGFRKDGSYEDNQASLRKSVSNLLAKYRVEDQSIGAVYTAALDGFGVKLEQSQVEIIEE